MSFSTKYTLEALTRTSKTVPNEPPPEIVPKLELLSQRCDRLEAILGTPLWISSAFRSPTVNNAVGGSATSAHLRGEAVDFTCASLTPLQVCVRLVKLGAVSELEIDQLIYEGSWVHVGWKTGKPRGQVLTRKVKQGKVVYASGIVVE